MGVLEDSRALVTGGTTGLGFAIAERFMAEGARVVGEQATGLYSVTKAATVMLGKMLALDLSAYGVRSNVLCPGDIWPACGTWCHPARRTGATIASGRCHPSAGSARRT